MIKKLTRLFTAVVLATNLYIGKTSAENLWANVQPAYNFTQQHPTVRVEGGTDITDKLSNYTFADIDSTRKAPTNLESFYVEGRFAYKANNWLAPMAEYNVGSNMKDILRIGVTLTPNLFEGNFTRIKILPYETSGEAGPQLAFFTSQDIIGKVSANALIEYNPMHGTFYGEPEVSIKAGGKTTLFGQNRCFGRIGKMKCDALAGIKYAF